MLTHELLVTEKLGWVLRFWEVHWEEPCISGKDLLLVLADVGNQLLGHLELLLRVGDVAFHKD